MSSRNRGGVVIPVLIGVAVLFVLSILVYFGAFHVPYNTPIFEEIEHYETAFLVQVVGDSNQAQFDSEAYLKENQIAAKRIQIPREWVTTGRLHNSGEYMFTHRLIKVDRRPETREWTAGKGGTDTNDQAIWVESKDSVGFSTDISITALIEPDNAAKFLFNYPAGSLAKVMDTEIRSRVQKIFTELAAKDDMSDLRGKKSEIFETLDKDERLVPYFKEKGITISTVTISGGFAYENPEVQKSIDGVFIAQREEEVNQARLKAQEVENDRIKIEAAALAEAAKEKARGEAEGQKLILEVAKDAAQDPVFLQLKMLEVERERLEKWDGKYPQWYMAGSGDNQIPLMLNVNPTKND